MKNVRSILAVLGAVVALWVLNLLSFLSAPSLWLICAIAMTVAAAVMLYSMWKNLPDGNVKKLFSDEIREWAGKHKRAIALTVIAVVVAALVLTALTMYKARGYRNIPWAFWFWCWFQLSAVVALAGFCWRYPKEVGEKVMYAIGDWIKRGGFWKFWSEDNLSANSLMILFICIAFSALLYGAPTPAIDPLMKVWNAQQKVESALNSPVAADMKETGLVVARAFLGDKLTGHEGRRRIEILKEKPKPLYHKSWFLVRLAFLLLLPGLIGWVFLSKRDEAANLVESLLEKLKRRTSSAVSASGEAVATAAQAVGGSVGSSAGSSTERQFASHVGANFVTEFAMEGLGALHKLLSRKGAIA